MKKIFTLLVLLGFGAVGFAQTHPLIDSIIKEVDLDSLVQQIRNFTGEDECMVNGQKKRIINRQSSKGNDLAAAYFKEQLEKLGLKPQYQDYSAQGKNIYAEQTGTTYPEQKVIISSHYDSMADYCADDNATGTMGIIEIARHLTKYKFKYSIVYATWDQEEEGLLGSKAYARAAKQKGEKIRGVLQMDMIGYDGNNDMKFEIHTKNVENSTEISDMMLAIDRDYNLKLEPIVKNPGTDRSDHASFWQNGYGAILLIEAFFSGDGNPYYHKATDRLDKLNLPYYHEMVKLLCGSLMKLAEPDDIINGTVSPLEAPAQLQLSSFPNPSFDKANVNYTLPYNSNVTVKVYDETGKELYTTANQSQVAGNHTLELNTSKFSNGIYHLMLTTGKEVKTHKLVVFK